MAPHTSEKIPPPQFVYVCMSIGYNMPVFNLAHY